MLNSKFFITSDGNLFDTSVKHWQFLPPLREKYSVACREINSVSDLKATIRRGSYTEYGSYPLYFITSDGVAVSFESVKQNFKSVVDSIKNQINDGWRVVGCDVNYEDDDLYCNHSGKKIASAYGGD